MPVEQTGTDREVVLRECSTACGAQPLGGVAGDGAILLRSPERAGPEAAPPARGGQPTVALVLCDPVPGGLSRSRSPALLVQAGPAPLGSAGRRCRG